MLLAIYDVLYSKYKTSHPVTLLSCISILIFRLELLKQVSKLSEAAPGGDVTGK